MNIKDYIVLAIMLAAIAAWSPTASAADIIGIYAGVSTGKAEILETTPVEDDTATKIYAGYKAFGPLGIEIAQIDLGEHYSNALSINSTAVDLVAFLPLPLIDLFAKVGVHSWDVDYVSPLLTDQSGTDSTYGFGLNFSVFPFVALRLEYERFKDIGNADMDLTSIGLNVSF